MVLKYIYLLITDLERSDICWILDYFSESQEIEAFALSVSFGKLGNFLTSRGNK